MKTWKVAHRMYLLVGVATVVMCGLAGLSWVSMAQLAARQDSSHQLAKRAGEMEHYSGLGAETYRAIADTAINRDFEASARRWATIKGETQAALATAASLAHDDNARNAVERARQTMGQIQTLYESRYLPMAQAAAPLSEMAAVDDEIDHLVSSFDNELSQIATDMVALADEADADFDRTVLITRRINTVAVLVGGALMAGLALWCTDAGVLAQICTPIDTGVHAPGRALLQPAEHG